MKARITETGALQVERAGHWKTQKCPPTFTHACTDECPNFEELETNCPHVAACGRPFEVVEDLRKGAA